MVWGQMGVKSSAGTPGCTMLPPAARLYAVEPVGVAIIKPSPCVPGPAGCTRLSEAVVAEQLFLEHSDVAGLRGSQQGRQKPLDSCGARAL